MKAGMWIGLVALVALVSLTSSVSAAYTYKPVGYSGYAGSSITASPFVPSGPFSSGSFLSGTVPSGMLLTSSAGASLYGATPSVNYAASMYGVNGAGVIGSISTFGKADYQTERSHVTYSDTSSASGIIYVYEKTYQF